MAQESIPKGIYPVTIAEAKVLQLERATKVFENHKRLKAIVERHELTLQKRWLKKSAFQRQSILKAVWPNITNVARVQWKSFLRHLEGSDDNAIDKATYMWPHLNLEDLSNPKHLLLLLKSRARNPPRVFAQIDIFGLELGTHLLALDVPAVLDSTALLDGDSPSQYGRIRRWPDLETANYWITQNRGSPAGTCLTALELQQGLLGFLVAWCEEILHDIPQEALLHKDVQPEPPIDFQESSTRPLLSTLRVERRYGVPNPIDFDLVESLLEGKITEAHDHLHSLREDPGYFAYWLNQFKEHNILRLMSGDETLRQASPDESQASWSRRLENLLVAAYTPIVDWQMVQKWFRELRAHCASHGARLALGGPVPAPIATAAACIVNHIQHVASSIFLHFHSTIPIPDGAKGTEWTLGAQLRRLHEDRPEGCPVTLGRLLFLYKQWKYGVWGGYEYVLDQIESEIERDATERASITPWIAILLDELALMAEMIQQLHRLFPWSSSIIDAFPGHLRESCTRAVAEEQRPTLELCLSIAEVAKRLAEPKYLNSKRFFYPANKKRTEQRVDQMCEAEKQLDDFWAVVEDEHTKYHGETAGLPGILAKLIPERQIRRTPLWSTMDVDVPKAQDLKFDPLDVKLAGLELVRRTESTLKPEEPTPLRVKEKTRGTAASMDLAQSKNIQMASSTSVSKTPDDSQGGSHYVVGKKAHKVFSCMFYNPDDGDVPGEISWSDFTNAMASIGFKVAKLYGSVWQFTPPDHERKPNMCIHEPHPESKLSYSLTRRIGRRFTRNYGWSSATFARK